MWVIMNKFNPSKQPKFYTVDQAARILGLTKRPITIRDWLSGGHFPGSYQQDGEWRYTVDGVWETVYGIAEIRRRNSIGDIRLLPDLGDAEPDAPPL